MIICGLDFETTGLSPQTDRVIEIGLVLWDTDLHAPVALYGSLVRSEVKVPKEVTTINNITDDMLQKYGVAQDAALCTVSGWMKKSEAACAHNGTGFDKLFYEQWCLREKKPFENTFLWIDTCIDLGAPIGRLIHAAAERGFVNPFPHRAVTDVLTMLRILDYYDANEVVRQARIPNVTVQALVNYDDREKAKARGYHWNGETRQWLRAVKEDQLEKEKREAPFKVLVMK